MSDDRPAHYRIGEFVLNLSTNELRSDAGMQTLEPLSAELLAYLARNAGNVVSLDDLFNDLWKGQYVTENSIYRQVAQLRSVLGDDAKNPSYIQTVRKRGYRLIAPVTTDDEPATAHASVTDAPKSSTSLRPLWLAGGLAVLAAAALGLSSLWQPAKSRDNVIAVLPFEALSPTTPDYLADGLARSLSDRLASLEGLFVIAHSSVREVAADEDRLQSIARQLGAEFLVAGTILVDETQQSARVSTALIRPEDGEQLWTRDAELGIDDMFSLHDAVAGEIATYLDVEVAPRESARVARLPADAYEALIKGRIALDSGYQPELLDEAIKEFTRALDTAPDLIEALSGRAIAHIRMYYNYIDRSPERLNLAREDVRRASEIDPDSAESLFARGYLESLTGSAESAIPLLRRAILMRPGNPEYLEALARNERRVGDYDRALEHLRKAVSVDPRNATLVYEVGLTEAVVGDYGAAERSFQTALSISPTAIESRIYLAWMYVLWLGDLGAANEQLYKLQSAIGEVEFMQLFLQPGLWGFFTYTDASFQEQLRTWDVREGGGELAAWYLAMAVAETRDGKPDAAAEYYALAAEQRRAGVAESPSDPWLTIELAIALAGAGEQEEAIATADRLLRLAPVEDDVYNNSDFLWARATVFVMLNMQDRAIAELRNAIRYPALITPLSLSLDPEWDQIFANEEFLALMNDDRTRWRADVFAGD